MPEGRRGLLVLVFRFWKTPGSPTGGLPGGLPGGHFVFSSKECTRFGEMNFRIHRIRCSEFVKNM